MEGPGRPMPVPSLDELAADPGKAAALPPGTVAALLIRLESARTALWLQAIANGQDGGIRPAASEPDRLLTAEDAARRLGTTPRWLYRHARQLPFTRRLSRKALRFSEAGLARYLASRRP
jgi:hypothetical protein